MRLGSASEPVPPMEIVSPAFLRGAMIVFAGPQPNCCVTLEYALNFFLRLVHNIGKSDNSRGRGYAASFQPASLFF